MKHCRRCKVVYPAERFYKNKSTKDGLSCYCQSCTKEVNLQWQRDNADTVNIKNKRWRQRNPTKVKTSQLRWNNRHPDRLKKYADRYRRNNLDKIAAYVRHRRRTNIQFRIASNLRSRLYHIIKGQKFGSHIRDLGCTMPELIQYLENLFLDDMTWDNYGIIWEIDHIISLASFDLTDRDQFLRAVHYTNLQPLYISKNRSKGAA